MIDINVFVAFGAGLVSFLAPCVLPLLPTYIGYVTGVSMRELKENGYQMYRRKILVTGLIYISGFSIVFVLMGVAASTFGAVLRSNSLLLQRIGGLIIFVLGMEYAGFFHLPFLQKTKQMKLPTSIEKFGHLRSFVLGVIFATAWSPCVGAVLGSILALVAANSSVSQGAFLLFIYSLGISIPFMLVSLTLASAPKYLKKITKHIGVITRVSGIVLAIMGLLLMLGWYGYLNTYAFRISDQFGWTEFLISKV